MNWILRWQGMKLYFACETCRTNMNRLIFGGMRSDRSLSENLKWRFKAVLVHLNTLVLLHGISQHTVKARQKS